MELYEVMRTTFACREFTGDPVPPEVLYRIIDNARFAPSGGNRQGWRVINITEPGLREGIAEEMRRDETVFCIGEDIGVPGGWGGAFTVTLNLEQEFPDRMLNTPISELGFFGAAVGAAIMGMRPIADV